MKVVYLGNSPVEIVGCRVVAEPGVPVDVPAEIARGLLEQVDMWKRATKPKTTASDSD